MILLDIEHVSAEITDLIPFRSSESVSASDCSMYLRGD